MKKLREVIPYQGHFEEFLKKQSKKVLVILLNGFVKKSQKTPKKEIDKAKRLMDQYYNEKYQK